MLLPMNLLLAISLLVNAAGGALNQTRTVGTFKFSKNHAGHSAVLKIRTKQFRSSEHRISRDAQNQTRVDGGLAWGTDGNVPNIEIVSMTLIIDGRELSIKKLFKDLVRVGSCNSWIQLSLRTNGTNFVFSSCEFVPSIRCPTRAVTEGEPVTL